MREVTDELILYYADEVHAICFAKNWQDVIQDCADRVTGCAYTVRIVHRAAA